MKMHLLEAAQSWLQNKSRGNAMAGNILLSKKRLP